MKSIVYAAKGFKDSKKNEKVTDEYVYNYLVGNFDTKKEIIKNLREDFESLNVDINNREENTPYNRSVVAAWSSFFLARQYEQNNKSLGFDDKEQKTIQGLISWNLEYPIKKKTGFWIRGPPDFGDI